MIQSNNQWLTLISLMKIVCVYIVFNNLNDSLNYLTCLPPFAY